MYLTVPPGKTQFSDANGKPLSGGKVYFYVPATSTPKDTWQDQGVTLNTNPVTLDASGEATILGLGSYRQVVTDSLGNQLWDQVADVPDGRGFLPLAGGTLTGSVSGPSVNVTGGQLLTVTPTGDAIATLASLSVQGTTLSTTTREYLAAISLISNKRNGAAGSVSPTVALYTGVQGQNGTGDIWSIRTTITQDASSGAYNALAHEITVVNNVAHRGDALGAAGLAAPTTYGHAVDATGSFRSTAAYIITGSGAQVFNRGFVVTNNAVVQAAFQDLGNSTISYEIQGAHTYGIDAKSANLGAFARLGNGQYILARDFADTVDWGLIIQSGTNLILGDSRAASVSIQNNVLPTGDNTYSCGSNGFRWAAVWAANGTIQTSDPSLKTDIQPLSALPPGAVDALLRGIDPITFRWASGGKDVEGNDRPGKRTHWGWNATQVKSAFDAVGMDFGGYVLAEDGVQHLRPDQLVPVLWRAAQLLAERIGTLEKRLAGLATP